jgi:hypothetical protein
MRCFSHTTIFCCSRNCSVDVTASVRYNLRLVVRFPFDVHTGNGSHIMDSRGKAAGAWRWSFTSMLCRSADTCQPVCVALNVARGRYTHIDVRLPTILPTQDTFKLFTVRVTNCKSFFLESFPVTKLNAYVRIFYFSWPQSLFMWLPFLKFLFISKAPYTLSVKLSDFTV